MRHYIPEEIKRNVRKKCWFGCIICGSPIFVYEHRLEYSQVREHSVENMFLICDSCHREKSSHRMPMEYYDRFARHPFNYQKEFTSTARTSRGVGKEASVDIGGIKFYLTFTSRDEIVMLSIDSLPVLSFTHEDGFLLLTLRLYEENIGIVLEIVRGEMRVNTGVWDYKYEGKNLRIWSEKFGQKLELVIYGRDVTVSEGYFKGQKIWVRVNNGELRSNNGTIISGGMSFLDGGLHFSENRGVQIY